MYSYLDEAILEGLILESAVATPYSVEENIKRAEWLCSMSFQVT